MPSTPTPTRKIRNEKVDGAGRYVRAASSSTSMISNDVKPILTELNAGLTQIDSEEDFQVEMVCTRILTNNTEKEKEKVEAMLLFDPSKQYFEFLNFIECNGHGARKWLGKCKSCNKNLTVNANVTSNMTTHLKKVFFLSTIKMNSPSSLSQNELRFPQKYLFTRLNKIRLTIGFGETGA